MAIAPRRMVLRLAGGMAALAWPGPWAAAMAALVLWQAWALWQAPPVWFPETVTVRLAPGQQVTVGAAELAAPRAEAAHLALRRDSGGQWHVQNLSAARPAALQRGRVEQRLAGAPLTGARAFQAGAALFSIEQADGAILRFRDPGHVWRYDGATLYRDGSAQPACPGAPLALRVMALWNRLVPRFATWSTPLSIGGHVHCGNRLGAPALAPDAAVVARSGGQLRFTAGALADSATALLVHTADGTVETQRLDAALAGATSVTVGGARYAVSALTGEALTLAPTRHIALYREARLPDGVPAAIGWQWRQRTPWQQADSWAARVALAAALLAACAAIAALAATPRNAAHARRPATPARSALPAQWATAAALLVAGIAAMATLRSGAPPAAALSLLLACGGAALWQMPQRRVPLAVRAALLLAMAGMLMQLELGLAMPDLAALRHYHKTAALLAVGSAVAAMWRLAQASWAARPLPQRSVEWLMALLAGGALAALAAQALWGDETGVFDMQPVELAKMALAALSAHSLALHLDRQPGRRRRWLRLAAPALLFGALLAMALVYVDDYSPLILLAVWSGCTALAYALAARRLLLAAGLALAATLLAVMVWHLHSGGATVQARLPAGFYADRFQVWLAPAEHPHTGQQWLQGARAIAAGGWGGADGLLGLGTAGQPDNMAAAIPAVQDDFAPSYFMYRHGLAGALLLWGAQAAMLLGLLQQAAACQRRAGAAQGFRNIWRERLRGFLLCSGAAFLLGHLLLSWGTNLAIFPVMGQPMSFIAAGGSHLLFFLCPLLAVSMDAVPPS